MNREPGASLKMAESSYTSSTIATYTARGFQGSHAISLQLSIPMSEEAVWKVFVLKHSEWFQHHSLLFESLKTGDTFYVHLVVVNDEVQLRCRNIDLTDSKYQTLRKDHLGTITKSAKNLLQTAAVVLKQLGSYHYVLNNCQVSILVHVYPHV